MEVLCEVMRFANEQQASWPLVFEKGSQICELDCEFRTGECPDGHGKDGQ